MSDQPLKEVMGENVLTWVEDGKLHVEIDLSHNQDEFSPFYRSKHSTPFSSPAYYRRMIGKTSGTRSVRVVENGSIKRLPVLLNLLCYEKKDEEEYERYKREAASVESC